MLTPQQKKFCQEYVLNHRNGEQAALAAGYARISARSTASRLLTKDNIKNEIERLEKLDDGEFIVKSNFITENLLDIVNRCKQGEPVFDKEGNPTGEWKFDPGSVLKALDLLGKRIGYFEKDNKQKAIQAFQVVVNSDETKYNLNKLEG